MSQFQPAPTAAGPQQVVAEVPSYAEAERLVDRLSDQGFPVERVRIVGSGVHTVEYVTGRLTTGRAAGAGALSGAWFGLLFGLLIGLFVPGRAWFALLVFSAVIGALWGAVFGFLAHYVTRGRRDFSSVRGLEADRYAIYVDAQNAAEAQRIIGPR
jgi:hypothetical protein